MEEAVAVHRGEEEAVAARRSEEAVTPRAELGPEPPHLAGLTEGRPGGRAGRKMAAGRCVAAR